MRSRRSATLPCGATGETPVVPVCGRNKLRPSRMGAAILVAGDADERPFYGGAPSTPGRWPSRRRGCQRVQGDMTSATGWHHRREDAWRPSALCVKHVSGVRAADAPPPCDHLPTVPVVAEEFNNAFHAHLVSTDVFRVIVSACRQVQARRCPGSLCGTWTSSGRTQRSWRSSSICSSAAYMVICCMGIV